MSTFTNKQIRARIENKGHKFLRGIGLHEEALVSVSANTMHVKVFESKSKTIRVMKALGAKVDKENHSARALLPDGGIVDIAWDLSVPRNERVTEVYLIHDDDAIHCAQIAAGLRDEGYDVSVADVLAWYEGQGSGSLAKAAKAIRQYLGRRSFHYAVDNDCLYDMVTYRLKMTKQRIVNGVDVSVTEYALQDEAESTRH